MGTGVTHSNVVGGTVEGPGRAEIVKVAFASLIGTSVEWYDFFLYGTAAALVFNKLFFPQFNPLTGTIAAFATFAVGFIARPIGGHRLRPLWRPDRPEEHAVPHVAHHGARHHRHRPFAHLLEHRDMGIGHPRGDAAVPGIRSGWRVGRSGAHGGRARPATPARLLRVLAADRRLHRSSALDLVFRWVSACRRPQFLDWGWRVPFLISFILVDHGPVHPDEDGGVARCSRR